MPKVFTPDSISTKREYIVENFLAKNTMNNIIAQAGVGKTRLAFQLAVSIATGNEFLGMKVKQSKVLIIDNDQSEEESNEMLMLCLNYYGLKTSPNILTSFQEDSYSIKDDRLIKMINSTDAEVVIIDSLTAMCHGINMSDSRDMQSIKKLYSECVGNGKTIIWLHHISEHKLGDFMTCDPSDLCMYSSVINGAMDAYFILHNPNKGVDLSRLLVRPVVKRYKIKSGIIETSQIETESSYHFNSAISIEKSEMLSQDEEDIMTIFKENPSPKSVNEVYAELKGTHGVNKVRNLLSKLESKNKLRLIRQKSNLFRYEIKLEEVK